jgi:hypothetical protein
MSKCFSKALRIVALTIGASWLFATTVAAAPQALTTTQVRDEFAQCGYQLGNPGAPATNRYVTLRDAGVDPTQDSDYRIAMAIVYPDADAARAAHMSAHQQAERQMGTTWPFSDDNGPQLLAGYGGSVWRGNVALVESTSRTLYSMYAYETETDEMTIARPELFKLGFVSITTRYAVDRDFVSCLENAAPITATAPESSPSSNQTDAVTTGVVEPLYLQGHPW